MRVYVFGGSKENPNWYFTESKLSKPFFKWDKENKRLYIMFFADSVNSIGAFHILTLKQLIVLPFKHRLYYSRKRAKARQHENYKKEYPED